MSRRKRNHRPNPQMSEETTAEMPTETTEETSEVESTEDTGFAENVSEDVVEAESDVETETTEETVGVSESITPEETVVDPGPVNQWSTERLLDFLRGNIDTGNIHALDVIEEYRRRETLEPAWGTQQVLTYFREGIEPARTENGVWVTDVTRLAREAPSWTNAELEAWATGEIDAQGKVTPATLRAEVMRRYHIHIADPTTNRVKAELAQQLHRHKHEQVVPQADPTPTKSQGLTKMNRTYIDDAIEDYATRVRPRLVVTQEEGRKAQHQLDRLFRYILNLEGTSMLQALERFKEAFTRHRDGVFSPSYIYRYTHLLTLKPSEREMHNGLLELFLVVTDPIKQRRKQVDMRYLLRSFPPELSDMLHDYFANHA